MGAPARRVRRASLVVFAALGVIAALALGEIAVRLRARSLPWFAQRLLEWDPIPLAIEPLGVDGLRPRAGLVVTYGNGTTAHENALHYRGPEVARPKPAGVFRVVLIGSSTAHGASVNDDATIDAFMRADPSWPASAPRLEVVNLGFDGLDAARELERLREEGLDFEPDAVIVHTGINDVPVVAHPEASVDTYTILDGAIRRMRAFEQRGGPSHWERVKDVSMLARMPGILRQARGGGVAGFLPPEPPAAGLVRFREQVRRSVELVPPSVPVILSTPPSAIGGSVAGEGYVFGDPVTTERYRVALAGELRALAGELAGEGRRVTYQAHEVERTPRYFVDDCHLTPDGNRLLAHDFVAALAPNAAP